MRKLIAFLLACIACWCYMSIGFGSGPTKGSPRTMTSIALPDCTYTVTICCGDTGRPVTFSRLSLAGTTPEDSVWISQLPKTLMFENRSTGPVKTVTLRMPGVQLEKVKPMNK